MGDPLSVAASIAGLVSLAGQLYTTLGTFITSIRDAPSLARTVRAELNSCRNTLLALQKLLGGPAFRPSRAALIPADHVVVSFTEAVLLFSELEATILPLANLHSNAFACRAKWVRKEAKLTTLISRLQWHKTTLVLQLNILKCTSNADAERDREALYEAVMQKLTQDSDLERRLELLESQLSHGTNQSITDNSSTLSATDQSDELTIVPGLDTHPHGTSAVQPSASTHRDFEESLMMSWVYRRNQAREEDMSFRSSICRQSAWSVLSDLSLANVSILSVIALPISIEELYNIEWYASATATNSGTMVATGHQTFLDAAFHEAGSVKPDVTGLPTAMKGEVKAQETPACIAEPDGVQRSTSEGESTEIVDDGDDEVYPCKRCGEILPEGKAYELAGDRWHLDCFRCNTCGVVIDADSEFRMGGDKSLICDNCTYSCNACGNKIEDLAILTGDQAFCAPCFTCRNCKRKIENLRYARTSQGIFCMPCHEALVAKKRVKMERKRTEAKLVEGLGQGTSLAADAQERPRVQGAPAGWI